ncbi:adenosylcobinamide-GDP ribazoletransferase [Thermaerobacillus caldiproteolyticus]|uniref:adenosylcobinamide-GDP ribazoletransferase n=1 Tax=Thermaerobacillus caldiproteolyticus TaxID=247480 RepID=UPI00188B343B|nr:adenosylcobinamide-GDP ribazoletransferase [Anoxybacillus caldiproteolyticus]QPA29887.1 adenosylcobinamide-GDP ribazoletransferase [Anoxybacillus caldiproteolyticus]
MKTIWHGWLLSLQFLTVIPIRKEINWQPATARWSVRCFPIVGLLIGGILAGWYSFFSSFTSVSPLFLSISLLWLSIFLSGGLHADGWMDVSDAFFSYRDVTRRQEIMKDSRVGAFAVLSIMFLLSFRFLFMYETIGSHVSVMFFVLIPLLSRGFMALLLIYGRLAKATGMAAAFREHVFKRDAYVVIAILLFWLVSISVGVPYVFEKLVMLTAGALVCFLGARSFCEKQFGGITGDMLGAFVEGVETWLWFIIWLLHFFDTV